MILPHILKITTQIKPVFPKWRYRFLFYTDCFPLFKPSCNLTFGNGIRKKKITEKELTGYLEEVILILEEEVSAGGLTELQYHDYVRLIRHAAERVFAKHRELREELAEQKEENAKQKAGTN